MEEDRILTSIKNSIEKAPIDLLDSIKSKNIPRMIKHDEITRQKNTRTIPKSILPMVSLAASLLFVFGIWQFNQNRPDSYVYLDVNPSIEIVTNKKDEVIDLVSFNKEGKDLIEDVEYRRRDLVPVTEELVKKMILTGYIRDSEDYLLVSVYNEVYKKKEDQKDRLNLSIHNFLKEEEFAPIVLLQNIEKTSTIEEYANEFGISPSRMTFIRNMIILNPELEVEDLVALSLKELIQVGRTMELDLESIIQSDDFNRIPQGPVIEDVGGDDLDYDYEDDYDDDLDDDEDEGTIDTGNEPEARRIISRDEALRIALSLTGGGRVVSVDLEEDDDEAKYEIEILKDSRKYEIEIHEYTGRVLDFEVDDED